MFVPASCGSAASADRSNDILSKVAHLPSEHTDLLISVSFCISLLSFFFTHYHIILFFMLLSPHIFLPFMTPVFFLKK